MNIEIEIKSDNAKNEIFDLRNFLKEEGINDIKNLNLKENPIQEGQMSITLAAILTGLIVPSVVGVAVDRLYSNVLEAPIKKWLQKRKEQGKTDIEIITSVKDNDNKHHFLTNINGETKSFDNINFALDVDRTKAILIGNSDFQYDFPAIPPVKGNIEDFYNLLTDKKIIGIPRENIVVLLNKTNDEIETKLIDLCEEKNLETLLIYYAGHGQRTDVNKLFLTAYNTRQRGDRVINGIDFDLIKNDILKHSTAKQKILILDACHSGIAAQGNDLIETGIDVKGTYVITSSSGDEVSYFHKDNKNTFFTAELLDTLKNGIENNNELITLDDIYETVTKNLKDKNYPEPRFKSELTIPTSNFYIAQNKKFTTENLKRKPRILFSQGKYNEALKEYHNLLAKFPNDASLKTEIVKIENDINFKQLVEKADDLFYNKKQYEIAIELYNKALTLKDDNSIIQKIKTCEKQIELFYQTIENKKIIAIDVTKAKQKYKDLYLIFYKNGKIEIQEREYLNERKNELSLTDEEVIEIETEILTVTKNEKKSISFEKSYEIGDKELLTWWNNLPLNWQELFKTELYLNSEPSIFHLRELINLKVLSISGKIFRDIEPLKMLKNLEELYCRNLIVTISDDFSPISNLNKLHTLDLSETKVYDFKFLYSLPSLKKLIIKNNNIDVSLFLEIQEKLKNCKIIDNV